MALWYPDPETEKTYGYPLTKSSSPIGAGPDTVIGDLPMGWTPQFAPETTMTMAPPTQPTVAPTLPPAGCGSTCGCDGGCGGEASTLPPVAPSGGRLDVPVTAGPVLAGGGMSVLMAAAKTWPWWVWVLIAGSAAYAVGSD